jgi:hypothetical protein
MVCCCALADRSRADRNRRALIVRLLFLSVVFFVSRRLPKRRHYRERECQREHDFYKLPNVVDTDRFLVFHPSGHRGHGNGKGLSRDKTPAEILRDKRDSFVH